jgi:hypothetical protein
MVTTRLFHLSASVAAGPEASLDGGAAALVDRPLKSPNSTVGRFEPHQANQQSPSSPSSPSPPTTTTWSKTLNSGRLLSPLPAAKTIFQRKSPPLSPRLRPVRSNLRTTRLRKVVSLPDMAEAQRIQLLLKVRVIKVRRI